MYLVERHVSSTWFPGSLLVHSEPIASEMSFHKISTVRVPLSYRALPLFFFSRLCTSHLVFPPLVLTALVPSSRPLPLLSSAPSLTARPHSYRPQLLSPQLPSSALVHVAPLLPAVILTSYPHLTERLRVGLVICRTAWMAIDIAFSLSACAKCCLNLHSRHTSTNLSHFMYTNNVPRH